MKKIAAFLTIALVSTSAFAQEAPATVSDVVSAMQTQMTTDITTVGLALIAVAAVAVGLRWVKGQLFN